MGVSFGFFMVALLCAVIQPIARDDKQGVFVIACLLMLAASGITHRLEAILRELKKG